MSVAPWSESQVESHPFPKLPLQHLSLSGVDHESILRILLKMQCFRSIVSLDVDTGWIAIFTALNDVLTQYGDQIMELIVHLFEGRFPGLLSQTLRT